MSVVYYSSETSTKKIEKLCEKVNVGTIKKGDLVAIKLTVGGIGNTHFVKPVYVKPVVDSIELYGGKPFLTDANVICGGARETAVEHMETAVAHGFTPNTVGAPFIVADGLAGNDYVEVEINKKHFKKVRVGSVVRDVKMLIGISHFTGHGIAGFSATLKNVGMGFANKEWKHQVHSYVISDVEEEKSKIYLDRCTGCGRCVKVCPIGAITLVDNKVNIDFEKCIEFNRRRGIPCTLCSWNCGPGGALDVGMEMSEGLQEKYVEVAYGVLKLIKKAVFMNFVVDVTPGCDCHGGEGSPIIPDVGILASTDPVALEQASVDLANSQKGIEGTLLKKGFESGQDKFRALFPRTDWQVQLRYAEELGLGSREYTLEKV